MLVNKRREKEWGMFLYAQRQYRTWMEEAMEAGKVIATELDTDGESHAG